MDASFKKETLITQKSKYYIICYNINNNAFFLVIIMDELTEFSGVNVFIGTAEQNRTIPKESAHNALIITLDDDEHFQSCFYYDPLGNPVSVGFENPQKILNDLVTFAEDHNVYRPLDSCFMFHLRPDAIKQLLPSLLGECIKPELEFAKEFFSTEGKENKFSKKLSRKKSGLAHSFYQVNEADFIQLQNKNECRVAWSNVLPTGEIFKTLPLNTSAAYVVVDSGNEEPLNLYYLKNEPDNLPILLSLRQYYPAFFEKFKLRNYGLSKDELSDLEDIYRHTSDTSNILGQGGFGRVKKSTLIQGELRFDYATKTQEIKNSLRLSKYESSELARLNREASITNALIPGATPLYLVDKKAVFHIPALGRSLTSVVPSLNFESKLDCAIQFLIAVNNVHKDGYAHRDLKLDNVMINENGQIYIIDYGSATKELHEKTENLEGTLIYAPLDQALIDFYLSESKAVQKSVEEDRSDDSDSDSDEQVVEWDDELSLSDGVLASESNIEQPGKNRIERWYYSLMNPELCQTENYLEDDKIAALRNIYCNPCLQSPNKSFSIFTTLDFQQLPEPIQTLFDTTYIEPLLSEARRGESEQFFAAVLIAYQNNRDLSDAEYISLIEDLRSNDHQQEQLIMSYINPDCFISSKKIRSGF